MRDCADKRGSADGAFTWVPQTTNSSLVVDELSLLLTAGRLNANNKQLIAGAYEAEGGGAAGLVAAQELLTLSAEFTSVTANEPTATRPERSEGAATGKPYQARLHSVYLKCTRYGWRPCRNLSATYAYQRVSPNGPRADDGSGSLS